MRVSIRDRATLCGIRPTLVAAYLRAQGWNRYIHEANRYSIWTRTLDGQNVELLLPLDPKITDFAERMAELLDDLQRVEERSQLEILRDIETVNFDVYRFREDPSTSFVGTIPIEKGAQFVGFARDFLLHGATAERSPERTSVAGRRADEVNDFMDRALLGQTEASSFVVRAQVPVPAKQQVPLFPGREAPKAEPFERRVGIRLMRVLHQTREAAIAALETSDYAVFSEILSNGATVALYGTVVEAQEIVPSSPLEVGCRWAPSRPVVGDQPSAVTFEPELITPIREAVRLLSPEQPKYEVQLVGAVERLERRDQEQESAIGGELALRCLVDGQVRKVRFFLEQPEYDRVIDAFKDVQPIAVTGDVVKVGKSWTLKNPHDVRIIGEPDADE